MKKICLTLLPAILICLLSISCENKEEKYKVVFKNNTDEISYVLGAINAKTIVNSGTESFEKLDKDAVIKGFKQNLNGTPAEACLSTLQLLFGPNYQDFNKKYVKEGSLCMGKMTGYAFYYDIRKLGGLDKVNFDMVKKGFEDGMFKRDTNFLQEPKMRETMRIFMTGLNVQNGNKMLEKARKIKNAQIFENGIVMETIEEGKGPNPDPTDDVKVQYILTSALGDTIQNSYDGDGKGNVAPIPLSLAGGVIPGWTFSIPKMKVGGKYRIYVPWNLAYGEQQGKESLCFFVELLAKGKTGTFVKEPTMPVQ
ncbi:MAG: hypothetical protein EBR91_09870 [Flavobacteriia bacterium]|jgi:hypothetical protein|nr:hypothetical protein [Flavobacteriia bacterium]NBV67948.1 hypothetical protein [Flavobacteriia bacterium]NBV92462.1 hypothetical protein [Flavobacteriia bacterium]NBY40034.1 hypothetical protein [Flavobacteriia bacterium]